MAIQGIGFLQNSLPRMAVEAVSGFFKAIGFQGKEAEPRALERCYAEIRLHGDSSNANPKVLLISKAIHTKMQLVVGQAVTLGERAFDYEVEESLPRNLVSMHFDCLEAVSKYLPSSQIFGTLLVAQREVVVLDEMMLDCRQCSLPDGYTFFFHKQQFGNELRRAICGKVLFRQECIKLRIEGIDYQFFAETEASCYRLSSRGRISIRLSSLERMPESWTTTAGSTLFFTIESVESALIYHEEVKNALYELKKKASVSNLQCGMAVDRREFWIKDGTFSLFDGSVKGKLRRIENKEGQECTLALCYGDPDIRFEHERLLHKERLTFARACDQKGLVVSEQQYPELEELYQKFVDGEYIGHILITGPSGCGKHLLADVLTAGVSGDVNQVSPADLTTAEGRFSPERLKNHSDTSRYQVVVLRSADYFFIEPEMNPLLMQLGETVRQQESCIVLISRSMPPKEMAEKFKHHIELGPLDREMSERLIGLYQGEFSDDLLDAAAGLTGLQIRQAVEDVVDEEDSIARLLALQPQRPNYIS